MNGRPPAKLFSFQPAGGPAAGLCPGPDWRRLCAALAVSCLLHAGLVFAPYFGKSSAPPRTATRPAQEPGPARALDVRLGQPSAPATAPALPALEVEPRPMSERAHGSDVLPVPAPAYYTADKLTKRPRPVVQPKLDVPREIARAVTGRVIVKLWINELGSVDSVEVESSNLPTTISGMVAEAFQKVPFEPGEIDGRRVGTLMSIEVTYLNGRRPPP